MKTTIILLIGLFSLPVLALDDTIANREQQASRFIAAKPTKEMLEEIFEPIIKADFPPEKRAMAKELLSKFTDWEAIKKGLKDSYIKIYTADELKALADFYESPAGRSAIKKTGVVYADIQPMLKLEISRAIVKAKLDKLNQK
jgi:hypothetical protein